MNATPSLGGMEDYATLSEGLHAIKLTVLTQQRKAIDTVAIEVQGPNQVPTCDILSPTIGSSGRLGRLLMLEGIATDPDISADVVNVTWTSDRDGCARDIYPNHQW